MGRLSKERTANVFLRCFCMWTICGATRNIAECKCILQQDLLKEFYFEFWLLVKWLECCVSKQTLSLWIGMSSRSAGPSQGSLKSCWGHQHCSPRRNCGISQIPGKPASQIYDTSSALTAWQAPTALILKSLEHLQTCKSWYFSAKGVLSTC